MRDGGGVRASQVDVWRVRGVVATGASGGRRCREQLLVGPPGLHLRAGGAACSLSKEEARQGKDDAGAMAEALPLSLPALSGIPARGLLPTSSSSSGAAELELRSDSLERRKEGIICGPCEQRRDCRSSNSS